MRPDNKLAFDDGEVIFPDAAGGPPAKSPKSDVGLQKRYHVVNILVPKTKASTENYISLPVEP